MHYTADQTLAILIEGNRKFSSGTIAVQSFQDAQQIMQADQKPIAVISQIKENRHINEL